MPQGESGSAPSGHGSLVLNPVSESALRSSPRAGRSRHQFRQRGSKRLARDQAGGVYVAAKQTAPSGAPTAAESVAVVANGSPASRRFRTATLAAPARTS